MDSHQSVQIEIPSRATQSLCTAHLLLPRNPGVSDLRSQDWLYKKPMEIAFPKPKLCEYLLFIHIVSHFFSNATDAYFSPWKQIWSWDRSGDDSRVAATANFSSACLTAMREEQDALVMAYVETVNASNNNHYCYTVAKCNRLLTRSFKLLTLFFKLFTLLLPAPSVQVTPTHMTLHGHGLLQNYFGDTN